jgi:hypothetical protein
VVQLLLPVTVAGRGAGSSKRQDGLNIMNVTAQIQLRTALSATVGKLAL